VFLSRADAFRAFQITLWKEVRRMMKIFGSTRGSAVAVLASLALGATACSEDDLGHELHVDLMRITVGAQQLTVNSAGAVTGTVNIVQGVATNVTVEFLDDAMADALAEHADDFQVQVEPDAGITFTRSGPFAGTITGTDIGAISVSFALFHIEENHEDFGPFPVNITVTGPPAAR
jgi:hypothetical protein